jgi:creatinine amidohydrolase/Fe(II)-dependent formamide hydrolase-like protein
MIRAAPWYGALFLLAAATGVPAAAPASVFVEDLTWSELRDRVRAGTTTLVIPIGGTEQNGPHMVLGKHNVRARVLAGKIARALDNALVAPVLAYVPEGSIEPPTSHMRFPGTITVPEATFEQVIAAAARSFRRHGFRDIVLLGDHGGYQRSLRAVAARLNKEWAATAVRAHAIDEYYRVLETTYAQALRSRGFRDDEIGTHAGLADTSLALAIDPGLVRTERLSAGTKLGPADGVYGDPRRASAELGRLGVDAIVTATIDAIRQATVRRAESARP